MNRVANPKLSRTLIWIPAFAGMSGILLASLAAAAPPADTLSDQAIAAYAAKPFDKGQMMFRRVVLGVNHGAVVVAEFPCGDVCPDYTVQVIHYAVTPGADCERIGGVTRMLRIPRGIAVMPAAYCVPAVLAGGGK